LQQRTTNVQQVVFSSDNNIQSVPPSDQRERLLAEQLSLQQRIIEVMGQREHLLIQLRLCDNEVSELNQQLGTIVRQLASSSAPNDSHSNDTLMSIAQSFVNSVIQNHDNTAHSNLIQATHAVHNFLSEEGHRLVFCVEVLITTRAKLASFPVQREVYVSLHLQVGDSLSFFPS
jgi:hypothetical protein